MDIDINLFDSIHQKTERLIKQYLALKEENSKLLKERDGYKEELSNTKEIINKLNEEIRLLRITKSIRSEHESSDLSFRIDELVREIDKSLDLLRK